MDSGFAVSSGSGWSGSCGEKKSSVPGESDYRGLGWSSGWSGSG